MFLEKYNRSLYEHTETGPRRLQGIELGNTVTLMDPWLLYLPRPTVRYEKSYPTQCVTLFNSKHATHLDLTSR